MALVDDDAVVLVDGRRRRAVAGVQHTLHHALHGGQVHGGVVVGRLDLQLLDAEDVGKGLQAFHARVLERVGGLLAQGRAVDEEQDAPEAFGLEQAVDQCDAGLGLAGARGHGQQDGALPIADAGFGGQDGALLVGPKREAEIKRRIGEFGVRAVVVTL